MWRFKPFASLRIGGHEFRQILHAWGNLNTVSLRLKGLTDFIRIGSHRTNSRKTHSSVHQVLRWCCRCHPFSHLCGSKGTHSCCVGWGSCGAVVKPLSPVFGGPGCGWRPLLDAASSNFRLHAESHAFAYLRLLALAMPEWMRRLEAAMHVGASLRGGEEMSKAATCQPLWEHRFGKPAR